MHCGTRSTLTPPAYSITCAPSAWQTPNTTGTPIIELPLASSDKMELVADLLWRDGVYVTLAAYPLVPHDQVGFRIQLTATHTPEQVDDLLRTIETLAAKGLLRPAADHE